MTALEFAAAELADRLADESWLTAVAVGADRRGPVIMLYVNRFLPGEQKDLERNGYNGFRVIVHRMGRPKP